MKFCYVDESGKSNEHVLVVAGIVADAHRMHVTKSDWLNIMNILAEAIGKPVAEFHTRHFYRGNGIWRNLDGEQRSALMNVILQWLRDRNHKVIFSAIDKSSAKECVGEHEFMHSTGSPNYLQIAVLHLMLQLQKHHQPEKKNKGHTVMVLDRGSDEEEVADMSLSPPVWTDTFYNYRPVIGKGKRQKPNPDPRLHQIIDVPYFADSKKVGLLQIADLFAYLLRHYAELQKGYTAEAYSGEKDKVENWVAQIASQMVPDSVRWPAVGGCDCSNWFRQMAPGSLVSVQKKLTG